MAELIPFDNREGKIWFDGELIEWNDAKIHVLNHGLHYGSSVFEGLRVYNGVPFKLRAHSERLIRSGELLGMKVPYTPEELDKAVEDVLVAQGITEGYVRPVAWRGSEQMAILTDKTKIHVAVAAWKWPPYYTKESKLEGARFTYAEWKRPAPDTAPSASKAAGLYMIATMSKNKAVEQGYQEALMLDYKGRIAETTSSNIFFVMKNGELHTPIADCFLNGLTRQTLIELAKDRQITVQERRMVTDDLKDVAECFVTGSAAEVTPVKSIEGELGDYYFEVGDTVKALMDDYENLVQNWKN